MQEIILMYLLANVNICWPIVIIIIGKLEFLKCSSLAKCGANKSGRKKATL